MFLSKKSSWKSVTSEKIVFIGECWGGWVLERGNFLKYRECVFFKNIIFINNIRSSHEKWSAVSAISNWSHHRYPAGSGEWWASHLPNDEHLILAQGASSSQKPYCVELPGWYVLSVHTSGSWVLYWSESCCTCVVIDSGGAEEPSSTKYCWVIPWCSVRKYDSEPYIWLRISHVGWWSMSSIRWWVLMWSIGDLSSLMIFAHASYLCWIRWFRWSLPSLAFGLTFFMLRWNCFGFLGSASDGHLKFEPRAAYSTLTLSLKEIYHCI